MARTIVVTGEGWHSHHMGSDHRTHNGGEEEMESAQPTHSITPLTWSAKKHRILNLMRP